jgi:hypothetical protein
VGKRRRRLEPLADRGRAVDDVAPDHPMAAPPAACAP